MVEQQTQDMLNSNDFDNRKLVKALGKGIKGCRTLNFEEAAHLIKGFSAGDISKAQMAAAMMLMRVRGESVEELAGVASGLKQLVSPQWQYINADIDWPVYAGKREQLPWLLLAAKMLVKQGKTLVLHGDSQSLPHRRHVESYIVALAIPQCKTPEQAAEMLAEHGVIYVNSADFIPVLNDCRALHQELGLRSLIQMSVRCVNPCNAPFSLRSFFHPGLDTLHHQVAQLVTEKSVKNADGQTVFQATDIAIFKGLQGETEVNPRVSTKVNLLRFDANNIAKLSSFDLPTQLEAFVGAKVGQSDLDAIVLAQLWRGEDIAETDLSTTQLQQAIASITASMALVNVLISKELMISDALKQAKKAWFNRTQNVSSNMCIPSNLWDSPEQASRSINLGAGS